MVKQRPQAKITPEVEMARLVAYKRWRARADQGSPVLGSPRRPGTNLKS